MVRERVAAALHPRVREAFVRDPAEHLCVELGVGAGTGTAELDRLEAELSTMDSEEAARSGVADRLRALLLRWDQPDVAGQADGIKSATDDEIFDFIGKEFGIS